MKAAVLDCWDPLNKLTSAHISYLAGLVERADRGEEDKLRLFGLE
jgi:hypothetical protein